MTEQNYSVSMIIMLIIQQFQLQIIFIKQQMNLRSTITQQFSPTFRRRIKSNYLALSLPGQGFFELNPSIPNPKQPLSPHSPHQPSSPSKAPSPSSSTNKTLQNFQSFLVSHSKINALVDQIDAHIRNRMQSHQEQLITVVKTEIENMQEQCRNVVKQYNAMIKQKNKEVEIANLRAEVEFFRAQALQYFQDNRAIKKENMELKELIKNKNSIIEDLNMAIKRSAKKYIKQKIISQSKQKQHSKKAEFLLTSLKKLTKKINPQSTQTKNSFQNKQVNIQTILNNSLQKQQQKQKSHPSLFKQNLLKIASKNNKQHFIPQTQRQRFIKKSLRVQTQLDSFEGKQFQYGVQIQVKDKNKNKNKGKSRSFGKFQMQSN